MSDTSLRNLLEFPYDKLEELNLEAKERQLKDSADDAHRDHYMRYLTDEKRIKAVTVCFSDVEGRFHMLDYDKKFMLKSADNLTFDGSSVRGFSQVSESDLRLAIDWGSFRWMPSDIFEAGKVVVFGLIRDANNKTYISDWRGRLKAYLEELKSSKGYTTNVAVECEGFLFEGRNAEQGFNPREGFKTVSTGGYYHSLPKDELRLFIDRFAEAQRATGFENEKDHPEVAPSQFELNYKYTDALIAADQVQLYKLLARQIAAISGRTASFLPKPIAGINGSGMHTNMSISKDGKNLFFQKGGEYNLAPLGVEFIDRILGVANDICLILSSSVNSYRRLDPNYEAPNQIRSSPVDRTSMIRVPLGNEKSARIEVRMVAPDANPYLAFYTLFRTGLEGPTGKITPETRKKGAGYLPSNIYDAIGHMQKSAFVEELMGSETKEKFIDRKIVSADRCPKELGDCVKEGEILFHHEVSNQEIWRNF